MKIPKILIFLLIFFNCKSYQLSRLSKKRNCYNYEIENLNKTKFIEKELSKYKKTLCKTELSFKQNLYNLQLFEGLYKDSLYDVVLILKSDTITYCKSFLRSKFEIKNNSIIETIVFGRTDLNFSFDSLYTIKYLKYNPLIVESFKNKVPYHLIKPIDSLFVIFKLQ